MLKENTYPRKYKSFSMYIRLFLMEVSGNRCRFLVTDSLMTYSQRVNVSSISRFNCLFPPLSYFGSPDAEEQLL